MQFNQIKYQDPATKAYLGSPSLIRLSNGDILATHDYFGPGCPHNNENEEHLTSVYRSSDDGITWTNVTHIANAFWSTLFEHKGSIYLLGASQQYGSIVIRRSNDNGNTWSHPSDEKSGLLFRGGVYHEPPNYHCAPVPVLMKNGRIYRAFEDCSPLMWPQGFQSLVVSTPEESDLLDASNWTMSNKLAFNPEWVPQTWGTLDAPGWLEGNIVDAPDGSIVNILRMHSAPLVDKAVIVNVSEDGQNISVDPSKCFIDFPGGMSKFTIRYDGFTGQYISLVNNNTDPNYPSQRNVLSLCSSNDLRCWKLYKVLLEDDQNLDYQDSINLTGFQYVDWHFDGDDIIYMSRTAHDGAHNFHDANRMTFHKLCNFREFLE